MEKNETSKLLSIINAAYSHFEINKERLITWHEVFCHLPYSLVLAALKEHIAESVFAPTPAHLLVKIKEAQEVDMPVGELIWNDVHQCAKGGISKNGCVTVLSQKYEKDERLASVISRAVQTLDWEACQHADNRQQVFIKKRFIEIYNDYLKREDIRRSFTHNEAKELLDSVNVNVKLIGAN